MTDQAHADPLYDAEHHSVSRLAFDSAELYEREMKEVFGKSWLYLGHESQIPNRRDFFTTQMGEESVIVVRDSTGTVRVHINACRHRGMQVCGADRGNTPAFTCSYHAWTYDTSGRLIGVPKYRSVYHGELDKSKLGLVSVPRVEMYNGLIFGCFDPDVIPLPEYLGDITYYIDHWLDRHEGGIEVVGVQRWLMDTNWKVGVDNNCGDIYHVFYTHSSIGHLARMRGQLKVGQEIQRDISDASIWFDASETNPTKQVVTESGHPVMVFDGNFEDTTRDDAVIEFDNETRAEVEQRLGKVRANMAATVGVVYPNFGWIVIGGQNTFRVYQPRGPHQTEMHSYCFVPTKAPQAVKDAMRKQLVQEMGPAGTFEMDDGANWTSIGQSNRTSLTSRERSDLSMGAGHEYDDHPDFRGRVTDGPSDICHRAFYTRWAEDVSRGGQ
ncbi:aromatic ring-hydroxylating oxygenase subunit alpha [Pseudonocardia sp. Cha107L01]|uniref:aromatic ring-hydroxylating oxygenase subunit alpha n=1 Tax=Pseudonocardia sp. Cha107L01 TaxID=3457576 RepID=UPI00403E722B